MPNLVYDNFYLSNEVEDQFNSHLDLMAFATVNNDLVGTPGMKYKVNTYSATDSVIDVAMGVGNTTDSEAGFVTKEYEIKTAQGRFKWFDEEEMTDPIAITTGIRHLGTDMFNKVNGEIYGELLNGIIVVPTSEFGFDAFVDAASMFNSEEDNIANVGLFALISPVDVAEVRKKLKDSLQYVEANVRMGYIGTVNGTPVYTKKDATPGVIVLATKEAVTVFNKKGTEYEPEREANTRMNRSYVRKYYVVALTDATKDVLLKKGTATLSTDTTVDTSKTYYAKAGLGYVAVTPESGDNPSTKGWYEIA